MQRLHLQQQHRQRRPPLQPPCGVKRARTAAAAVTARASAAIEWQQTRNGSWVASPRQQSAAAARRPPGVVHLLGGAFAGAAPQVLYARLAEALAAPPSRRRGKSGGNGGNGGGNGGGGAGWTVVATPYRVTFDHLRSAESVRRALREAVEEVAGAGGDDAPAFPDPARRACAAVLAGRAPLLAVGHSNGALLHCLGACQQQQQQDDDDEREGGAGPPSTSSPSSPSSSSLPPPLLRPRALVLVSYNNKAVGDAVPFGLLDRLRDALPPPSPGEGAAPSSPRLPELPAPLGPLAEALVSPRIARASPAVEQVATVADEVRRGASDFSPPPAVTRQIVASSFPRALRTLLVRFSDDATDETPELARLLADRPSVGSIVLPGTHLTPCGADGALLRESPLAAGMWGGAAASGRRIRPFTPADALAMAAREWGRADRERDADRFEERVVGFLRAASAAEDGGGSVRV
jgi:hypothetical protein